MAKKGEEISLWFLLELVGAVVVAYLAVDVSLSYTQGTIYEKLNIAKDLAMQINTLQALPGDGYIINSNLHGYSVYFYDDRIEVYENEYVAIKGTYNFVKPFNSKIDVKFIEPKQIIIAKINGEIRISGEYD